ncbi:hypothetical protein [Lucifera butyrica]|nr:hypothetical protein [Lucifera butyrica]
MLCFLFVGPVYAAAAGTNEWDIPFLGTMAKPDGFVAVDIEQWAKDLTALYPAKKDKKTQPAAAVKVPANSPVKMPTDLKLYQLQVSDGKVYHIAGAVALRDDTMDGANYFFSAFKTVQAQRIEEINRNITANIRSIQDAVAKTNLFTFQILDLSLFSRLNPNGGNDAIYTASGRVIVNMNGLIMPMHGKVYVAKRDGRLAALLIFTYDSDGKFWDTTADRLMTSLKYNKKDR